MRALVLLSFLLIPVLEIWLLIQIGGVIGGWTTVGLLVLGMLLGGWLVRREGLKVWRDINAALASGKMPDRELGDGALLMAGGALLLIPGFLTDIVGFACILPFTRPVVRKVGNWMFKRRLEKMAAASPYAGINLGMPFTPPGASRPEEAERPSGPVIHGEVLRDERREPPEAGSPRPLDPRRTS
ncbi:FxsA family protein [Sinosporangium siamense]|uniref:Membrane protein n=1 Tax=Sinosporangium siamense TaxID=1367973 RepID=A0A919V956_9ACTN|nr:FxsA family protein [Sinosporangium siamense]GII93947.1 membrane protein [Sinosporangium siamense]